MGKVKIKKKETRIDMTAMSDVTVLLLTFFMLTSTFLQKEPITVITPPSVSEEKVPDEKLVTVMVGQDGKVFMSLAGTKDSTLIKSEDLRAKVIQNVVAKYNERFSPKVNLTNKQVETFSKIGSFGVPIASLPKWLDMPMEDRDKALKNAGIPIEKNFDATNPTEFQMWVNAVYDVMYDAGVQEDMESGKGIAIKADQTTPYNLVEVVMNNLQTIKMNRFTLMTALTKEEE